MSHIAVAAVTDAILQGPPPLPPPLPDPSDTSFLDQDAVLLEAASWNPAHGIGTLEQLPKWLILIPIVLQWIWLSIRHHSFTLPAAANPTIATGGLVGEGKSEYFRIMGRHARSKTADHTILVNRGTAALAEADRLMRASNLRFPIIAKPDIGWCGFGVRLVRNRAELRTYLTLFPHGERIILQRFVAFEGEAGLYYVRFPGQDRGALTGIVLRSFPRVMGDGIRTVGQLIAAHPRASRLARDGRSEPCCDPGYVPLLREMIRVSITGSTRVGGLYKDAGGLITPQLTDAIHAIAEDMTDLHVARFDVRYESLEALRAGLGFTIIEVNGVGSEAVHAWDPEYALPKALKIIFAKQRIIFAVGAAMRQRGHKPLGLFALFAFHLKQARLIKRYPPSN